MQICKSHWDKLKQAIADRGLSHLISKDGTEAVERTIKQLDGKDDPKRDYDPLLAANYAIWENAIKCAGLGMMFGDICPLCDMDRAKYPETSDDWIKYAADGQLGYCKENN